jgi:hypothetical protein
MTARDIRVTRIKRASQWSEVFVPKQNVTVSLSEETLRKAKILAAQRGSSISGLLAAQIEILTGEEEAYERAQRDAKAMLDKGFHLGGVIRAGREQWHER